MVSRRPDGFREQVDHEQIARERADGTRCQQCGMCFGPDDARVLMPGDEPRAYHVHCAWMAGLVVYEQPLRAAPDFSKSDLFGE